MERGLFGLAFEREMALMMGVVLWSDPEDQKAVFWCEDHGDLAYYDATNVSTFGQGFLNPGDMVEFEVSLERKVRRAHSARVIEAKVCNDLQDHLRFTAGQSSSAPTRPYAANVIDMVPRQAQRRPA